MRGAGKPVRGSEQLPGTVPGERVAGPTIVLEETATTYLDQGFAAKVDASVERVLTLKERMGLLPCSTTKPS